MKLNFNIQTQGMQNMQDTVKEKAKEVLWRSMVKIEELAKNKAPVDTGMLKNRIHLEPMQPGSEKYELSDGVEYGIYVEYGTKPHYVPITPLKDWAGRVLGDKNLAYSIRAKIAKQGTAAQPFFRPAIHEVQIKWLPIITDKVFNAQP